MPLLTVTSPSKLCTGTNTVTSVPGLSFALHDLISSVQSETFWDVTLAESDRGAQQIDSSAPDYISVILVNV
jgi:hypothetical protein